MKKTLYILLLIGVIVFSGIQLVKAYPSINILGNRAVVGPGLNATTTANAHLTASGTIAFVSLGSSGNPCLTIGTDGTLATSTCGGGGGGGVATTTPFTTGYIPFATSSSAITNSNIFQSGSNIGIGTTTPSFLLEVLGDLKVNTSSTLGNIISGNWQGTAITDSYISSAATWNAKQNALSFPLTYASTTHITATTPLIITSGVLSMSTSTTAIDGFLSATDWTTFNNKVGTSRLLTAGAGLTGGGDLSADRTFTVGAGTGITVNADSIDNSGVLSLVASSSIGISNSTGTINIGAKNYPIQFIIESPTASENDNIFIFNTTSTITKVLAVNKSAGDTITFGLGYSTSQGTATSSLTNLFSAQTIISTSTPTSITLTSASSTPGINNVLKLWTTAASSSQFTITAFYTEN